ncbi:myosin-11-like [Diprion similis]|uniref:myosin-11-like n=1 Tax=Diprion similis TaxID=362088 RepID=UPI001EF7F2A9|nr:myosin-11-like [Diprion similis]
MYKSAVILVLLVGTACAFPPKNILGKSVAEDATDKKAPEVPPQGSEVESQKEDATRESDDELTPTIALSRTETPSPTSSDRSTEGQKDRESSSGKDDQCQFLSACTDQELDYSPVDWRDEIEEPKKLCDNTATGCNLLGELAPRRKRNTETLPLNQTLIIPLDKLGVIDISKMKKANLLSHNTEVPNYSGSDMNKPFESVIILDDNSDLERLHMTNVSPSDMKSGDTIVISVGKVKIPIFISRDICGSETSTNELKKLQEENEVVKKKLKKAEEDLAKQKQESNDEKNRIEEKEKGKEDQERKTLQEKYDAAVKALVEELADLEVKFDQQSRNFTRTVQEEKKACERTLKDNEEGEKQKCKTLQEKHDAVVKALVEELADLEVQYDQQSRNFTTTVQGEKQACEEMLKGNEEEENQERKKLQEKRDDEIKSLEASLTKAEQLSNDLATQMSRVSANCNKNLEAEKERCNNQLTERTERAKKELAERKDSCDARIKEKETNMKKLQDLLALCRKIGQVLLTERYPVLTVFRYCAEGKKQIKREHVYNKELESYCI